MVCIENADYSDVKIGPLLAPLGGMTRFIQEADRIIAFPKIKTHAFQFMTLACKIMYGAVPGLTKGAYHARFPSRTSFADMLLDLLTGIKPDLYIMDGIVAMEGQGPANGDPVHLGLVMAATDPVLLLS